MDTGVTGLTGGVKVNDARATSLSLPVVKPATVMVHLGRVLVGGWFWEWRTEGCCF